MGQPTPAELSKTAKLRVLVIDDEPGIVDFLQLGLEYEGFVVESALDGVTGLKLALAERPPDLIILDLMLPGMDGYTVCQRLRQASPVPIIMLTARDELDERVQGLDYGADDYLTKPFQFKELAARIRAVLRRRSGQAGSAGETASNSAGQILKLLDITLNKDSREVWRGDKLIEFSLREYELLELLMSHPNQVLTRTTILDQVWGYNFVGDDNIIEVYVRYLRQKLGEPNPIGTVRGVGYVMKSVLKEA